MYFFDEMPFPSCSIRNPGENAQMICLVGFRICAHQPFVPRATYRLDGTALLLLQFENP